MQQKLGETTLLKARLSYKFWFQKKEVWVGAYFSMDWLESHLKASPYVVLIHQSI